MEVIGQGGNACRVNLLLYAVDAVLVEDSREYLGEFGAVFRTRKLKVS